MRLQPFFPLVMALAAPAVNAAGGLLLQPLHNEGLDVETHAAFKAALEDEARHLPDLQVLAVDAGVVVPDTACTDTRADGTDRTTCLAKRAAVVGAAVLVTGSVRVDSAASCAVSLTAIDVAAGSLRGGLVEKGACEPALARAAIVRLLAPQTYVGTLAVDGNADGAELVVDGQSRGVLPLQDALTGLVPGRHDVEVKDAAGALRAFVDVRFHKVTQLTVTRTEGKLAWKKDGAAIVADGDAGPPRWLGGAITVFGGAAAVGAGLLTWIWAGTDASALAEEPAPVPQDLVDANRTKTVIGSGLFVVGGAAVVAGGTWLWLSAGDVE